MHPNLLEVVEVPKLKKSVGNQQGSVRSSNASTRSSKNPDSSEPQAWMQANWESALSSPADVQKNAAFSSNF